ncbi:MAG: hypothetical protein Q7R41_10165 [Phycisphaerales bacterium]|nr:hypothetical protein [Phycisphaerales bacterium]
MTEPFRVATLASVQSARIAAVRFEEGAYAAEGEVVVALQDGVQRARTELARAAVDTSLPIDLERAKLTRARRDLERLKRLQGDDFASSKELSDALAVAEIAQVEYDLSVFNQEQARRAYEREKETLAEYQIRAPFPAYVSNHLKHAGESVDQLEGIVRLVQLDPLLVSVDCPLTLATSVAIGDRYVVRPVDPQSASLTRDDATLHRDPHWQPRTGTVVFANQVADAASQTFKVKLTVDNADRRWIAGLKVVVDFSIDEGARDRIGSVNAETDSSSTARDERRTQAAIAP